MSDNATNAMPVAFTLDGQAIGIDVPPDRRLVDILREDRFETATKHACGIGRCGACTVLLDGLPVNACLVMAWQLSGKAVTTSAGLDALPEAAIVRDAMAAENAFQCGYCAPGMVTVLTALLRDHPDAGEPEIRAALEGNICRCTGYQSIIRGALAAAAALQARKRDRA